VKNVVVMIVTCTVLCAALAAGMRTPPAEAEAGAPQKSEDARQKIPYPHIGRIQVLNGCGAVGAAKTVADFLRSKKFDVKDEGNAKSDNYDTTMVVSRNKDKTIAQQVAQTLNIHSVVLMRNGEDMYDVTVFVGSDFQERVR
jgi:hypothetical protein